MLEVRFLEPADWATWRELRLAALAEAPYAFGSTLADWTGARDREERWRARLEIPGSRNLLAVLDDRPAGMASGLPAEDGESAELISMWVSPLARGRGVADLLIETVEQWAADRRAKTLRLSVRAGNGWAIALYERHGFARTDEPGELQPDGVTRELVMAKGLETRQAR